MRRTLILAVSIAALALPVVAAKPMRVSRWRDVQRGSLQPD